MQVVIDIPEDIYERMKNGDLPIYMAYKYVKNGTPLNEVLNKIRSEIEVLPRDLPTDARNMVRRTRVLDIIDKYRKSEGELCGK